MIKYVADNQNQIFKKLQNFTSGAAKFLFGVRNNSTPFPLFPFTSFPHSSLIFPCLAYLPITLPFG